VPVTLADGQLTDPKATANPSMIEPHHRFAHGAQEPAPMQLDLKAPDDLST
jgi:hypothetical protein